MGCCGGDREKGPTKASQKWDYITLTDFKATSPWNTVAYAWLWILFMSTILIYAVDTFTAVNLLIFNKWASQVQPAIPFEYSKWIFAGCIIFSWILWGFEWFRAIRVIRRGGVAESYMDPLAAELQSMRKQGWRRFLVFAALTKSKKGADLIAFFAYFAFKGAIRIIIAEGPRQVINTLTLIAVIKADFIENTSSGETGISLFLANLTTMWDKQKLQAIIIFSMMYSLAIWVISVICLATAAVLYIIFLWHYLPSGGVAKYCRHKVDKRLEKIVESKVKAAIEEEERKRRKAEEKQYKAGLKAEKKGKVIDDDDKPAFDRQPTLPKLDGADNEPSYILQRQETTTSVSTLPMYNSRPSTRNEIRPPLPGYPSDRPLPPTRSATMGSQWSNQNYDPDAPLLANAAQAGETGPILRPGTAFSRKESNASYGAPPMPRTMTPAQYPYTPGQGPPRMPIADGQRPYSPGPGSRIPAANGQRPYSPGPGPRMPTADGQRPYSPGPGPKMPGADGQRPYSPGPGRQGGEKQRAFSPMLRTDFSQTGSSGPQSALERTGSPWSRDPAARSESPFGGPRMPTERSNTGPAPTRQGANTSIDQPLPAMTRQQTFGSTSSNGSFSRPMPSQQRPSQPNFNRPFSPAGANVVASPLESTNSYEMRLNPYTSSATSSESKNAGSYVAFNPGRSASPAPMRSNTATTDYFTSKPQAEGPARSITASPPDNRQTFGYTDLVSSYGRNDTPSPPPPAPEKTWNSNRF